MPGVTVRIPVDRKVKPVQQPWRKIRLNLQGKVQDKIQDLIDRKIVEPVQGFSKWQSPLVIVPKKGGDIRVCVDLRLVNKAVKPEKYPIPTIEDVSAKLEGCTVFSTLDLRDAFHHVRLDDESKELTTFITNTGLYRYNVLMFGLCSASETF